MIPKSVIQMLYDSKINENDVPYSFKELKAAIRYFYDLPASIPIMIDLRLVYSWLGKEWQDVFDLYSLGFAMEDIHYYWSTIHGPVGNIWRQSGDKVVNALIRRIIWLMSLTTRPVPVGRKLL